MLYLIHYLRLSWLFFLAYCMFPFEVAFAQPQSQNWLDVERLAMPAQTLVLTQKKLLGMGVNDDLRPARIAQTDDLGYTHHRYQQIFKGIAVENAVLLVHERNGMAYLANGNMLRNLQGDATPNLAPEQALQRALAHIGATKYAWQDPQYEAIIKEIENKPEATYYPSGELVWVAPTLTNNDAQTYRLAYKFDVYAIAPLKRAYIYIDAQNGKLVAEQNQLHDVDIAATGNDAYSCSNPVNITADNVGGFNRLRETQRGGGIETYTAMNSNSYPLFDITDTDTYFNNDPTAVSAHRCTEATYDYFKNTFNRNSIDGNGYKLKSWVHYGIDEQNAFWNGTFMTYGDGGSLFSALTSPDVVAHEIAHGLTQFEANLVYAYEPGALNESFSDIFGTVIEHQANPTCADWIIGSDIALTTNGFRSMSNPNDATMYTQCPDTYGGTYWINNSNDYGGVHTNSGVQNFWFYLLSNGGSGTNDNNTPYTVTGIGMDKAARIAYRNLTVYLTPTSQYLNARAGAIQAATDLYGANSNEVAQVTAAWCAVGVGNCTAANNSLTLTAPNGGEIWQYGSTQNITWTTTGTVPTVNIDYSIDGGATWNNIAANVSNTGNMAWEVPNASSSQAKMRVSAALNAGLQDMSDATFTIQGCDVVANFGYNVAQPCGVTSSGGDIFANYLVSFIGSAGGTGSLTYTWQIDGTNVGNAPNLSHTFANAGNFTVALTVSNGACSDTYTRTMLVNPTADASFTHTESDLTANVYAAQNGATTYNWDFGDGSTATTQNAVHTYSTAGTYNVCLTTQRDGNTNIGGQVEQTFAACRSDYDNNNSDGDGNESTGTTDIQNQYPTTFDAWNAYNQVNSRAAWQICNDVVATPAKREGLYAVIENTIQIPANAQIDGLTFRYNYISTTGTGQGDHDGWGVYFNNFPACVGNSTYPYNVLTDAIGYPIGYPDNQDPDGDNHFPDAFPVTAFEVRNASAAHINVLQNLIDALPNDECAIEFTYYYIISSNSQYWDACFNVDVSYHFIDSDIDYFCQPITVTNPQPCTQTTSTIDWQNTIGGSGYDGLYSIAQTTDGGYIFGGYSNSNISGDKTENSQGVNDYWVVKLNATGTIQWQNTIGGSDTDVLQSIAQTTDGGYILGASSDSNISGDKTENSQGVNDYWVVKLNATGAIQWQNTIGGSGNDYLYSIAQTTDGGYILGGRSDSNISGDKTENSQGDSDYWVVKLNATGTIQWQNTIGGSDTDVLQSIAQTTDGGYILGGLSGSNISGDKTENCQGLYDYWVVKLNATGTIQWQNAIGGSNSDNLESIAQTTDGGYILGGYSDSNISSDKTENSQGGRDYWIVKLDATGTIQWQNTIGGSSYDYLQSIAQTTDGGYILGGHSDSNISGDKTENSQGNSDYWVVKLNATGTIQWQNAIGGSNSDYLESIAQTTDGGYILGGRSNSNISGDKTENGQGSQDYWVVKLSAQTSTIPSPTAQFTTPTTPTCATTPITFTNTSTGATAYQWSVNGVVLATTTHFTHNFAAAGTYTVTLEAANGTCSDTYSQTITINANALNLEVPDVAICGTSALLDCGIADALYYLWDLNGTLVGNTQSISVTQSGIYTLSVADACGNVGFDSQINVLLDDNCVWSGDFNYDGIANNYDLLHWGWASGHSGAARPNASYTWQAQPCSDWANSQQNGTNYKHADGNGNGIIDNNDPQAIISNYGQTHGIAPAVNNTASPLSITAVVNQMPTAIGNNTLLYIDLYLNNSDNASTTLYGAAFKVDYLFPSAFHIHNATINFNGSWLGSDGVNMRSVQKNFINSNDNGGYIEVAVSRNDHQNATGSSKVATLIAEIDVVNSGGAMQAFVSATNAQVSLANGNIMGISNSSNMSFSLSPSTAPTGLVLQPTVWLNGAYNTATNQMKTTLRSNNLLPLQQPYNISPYNYSGTEMFANIANMPSNAVDWVLVELRSASNIQQNVVRKAALLLANGSVVDIDGVTNGVRFPTVAAGNYYVVIRHRNHIDIVSNNTINLSNGIISSLDLGNASNVMGGVAQVTVLANGKYALKGGDFDHNGIINVSDFNLFRSQAATINQYNAADCNFDGNVTTNDFNVYMLNPAAIGVSAIRY
jgi:Zn-dependent metalloprotease/PKD repeat protein